MLEHHSQNTKARISNKILIKIIKNLLNTPIKITASPKSGKV